MEFVRSELREPLLRFGHRESMRFVTRLKGESGIGLNCVPTHICGLVRRNRIHPRTIPTNIAVRREWTTRSDSLGLAGPDGESHPVPCLKLVVEAD
jgi:hypothetical protein